MRNPFRLAVPNWFGDPIPALVGQRPAVRTAICSLWRRALGLRRLPGWCAPAVATRKSHLRLAGRH